MRELIDAQLDAIGGGFREPVLEHKGNETIVRDILEISFQVCRAPRLGFAPTADIAQ
jgi:hypothetical protein